MFWRVRAWSRRAALFLLFGLQTGFWASAAVATDEDLVVRVVDGDTVILERLGRARLIGVDAPESAKPDSPQERFGKESSRFARNELEGRHVRVEIGPEPADQYGRALVYLFQPDGGLFNLRLVREGFAYAYTLFPTRYQFELLEAEDLARNEGKGLWEFLPPGDRTRPLHGNSRSRIYHSSRCEYYDCRNCTVELKSRAEAERLGFRPHWGCIGNR